MTSAPYLDIHSHRKTSFDGTECVLSLSEEDIRLQRVPQGPATAGVHPWWLEDYTGEEIQLFRGNIEKMAKAGLLWGIGETGIDRAYPEFLDQQKELLQWHLDLAEKHGLPVVIHNVRSGSDFLEVLKRRSPQTPWIFHDFRGNEELVRNLLRLHPESYFSFGLSVDNSPQVRELLPLIPLDHLFLETDAQKHLDIHDIYLRAAEQLQVDLEFLKSQLWHNFNTLR